MDNLPKGKELAVAKKVCDLITEMDKQEMDYSPWMEIHHASIKIDHAIEGVRCNGTQELNTVWDIVKCLEELKRDMVKAIDRAEETIGLIKDADKIIKNSLALCGKCGGTKGKWEKSGQIINYWEDCTECHGRGAFPK